MRPLLLALGLLLLAGCASKPRFEPAPLKKIADAQVRVEPGWKADVGSLAGSTALRPLIAAGRVFTADAQGRLQARDADGALLWERETEQRLGAGPALVDGQLIVGGRDGTLAAFAATDGEPRWQRLLSSEIGTLPAGDERLLVVKTEDGRVHALDPADGRTRWVVPLTVPPLTWRGNAALALLDDVVLVGTATGRVKALAINDGALAWEQSIAEPSGRSEVERLVDVDADLLLAGPVVVASSSAGSTKVLRRDSGLPLWERGLGGYVQPAIDENCLYVVDAQDAVHCLEPSSGAAQWAQEQLGYRRLTAPVAYRGNVVLGDSEGYAHVLSTADGRIIGRARLGRAPLQWVGPAPDGEGLLALARDGRLQRFVVEPQATAE